MRLLVGVATAAVFHGLVFGAGLLLLPRQAVPAPAPAQVDVDVVDGAPGSDRSSARAQLPPRFPRPCGRTRTARRGDRRLPVAAAAPEAAAVTAVGAVAAPRPGAGAIGPSRAAAPAPEGDVTPAQPQYLEQPGARSTRSAATAATRRGPCC